MAFLQIQFFNQAKPKPKSIKNSSGFMTVALMCFLSLMILFLSAFALLSVGIKNITKTQTHCITGLFQTQKELGQVLSQLLALNQRSVQLKRARQTTEASLAIATASVVLIPKIPILEGTRKTIIGLQKVLIVKQKFLLTKAFLIKQSRLGELKRKFKKFKASQIRESSFYKKALAVKKQQIGKDSYIYKPVDNFKNHQKITLAWKLFPFHPLIKDWDYIFPSNEKKNGNYSCSVTLNKEGNQWTSQLYH